MFNQNFSYRKIFLFLVFIVLIIPIQAQNESMFVQDEFNNLLVQYTDSGNIEKVKLLLQSGANPNSTYNGCDITALMYACQNGYYDIAELLIASGADVNIKPVDGNTALFAAVRSNQDSIAELLILKGANINEKNYSKNTPLHYAAGFGYPYLTELLLYYGASTDSVDFDGNSPLMVATYSGAINSLQILVEYGANVNCNDNNGTTPLMVAAQFNDTAVIRYLYHSDSDLYSKNNRNSDAISYAISNGSVDALSILIDLYNQDSLNKNKESYNQLASNYGITGISNILKNKGIASKVKPGIHKVNFYTGYDFSYDDFMLDFGTGIFEPVTRLSLNLGFKYRPVSCRVVEFRDLTEYQFWEKRYSFYLALNYYHPLVFTPKSKFGFTPGMNCELTWNKFRGTANSNGVIIIPVPNIGFYYSRNYWMFTFFWSYTNYKIPEFDRNRFGMRFFLTLPIKKSNVVNKRISWLD